MAKAARDDHPVRKRLRSSLQISNLKTNNALDKTDFSNPPSSDPLEYLNERLASTTINSWRKSSYM